MLSSQSIAGYILPLPVIALDLDSGSDRSRGDESRCLAKNAALIAEFRADLKEQTENFEKLYQAVEQSEAAPADLERVAGFILERESQAAATLSPHIQELERTLAQKHRPTHFIRSLRRLAEEALDAVRAWLEVFQKLRIRLLKLASDRRVATGETGSPVLSDAAEMERYLRRIAEG